MKTIRTLPVAVALLCAALAACNRLPTDHASAAPAHASYDSGFGVGSGNGTGVGGEDDPTASTTASDTTGRGGFTIGSGG